MARLSSARALRAPPRTAANYDRQRRREPVSTDIACDESGYEGEKLVAATTDVFAHASVRLDPAAAQACVQELRRRIRSPATEYKANHLLREKHRPALLWLLDGRGPLHGRAHVHLVDKTYLLLDRLVDVLVPGTAATALYRDGACVFGAGRWQAFLVAANTVLRARDRLDAGAPVGSFFRALDTLDAAGPAELRDAVRRLRASKARLRAHRARLVDEPAVIPVLDPLFPAVVRAVGYWADGGAPVSVVHDRQNTFTAERLAQLDVLAGDRLAGLRLAESSTDARVQVADFLAGVARKIASDELNGRGDAELTALVRPYVDTASVWGDPRSWAELAPAAGRRPRR